MILLQRVAPAKRGFGTGSLVSAALHLSALSFLILVGAKAPRIVPVHNPGSQVGKHVLLTYSTGAAPSPAVQSAVTKQVTAVTKAAAKAAASATESKPMAEQGSGSAGLSGLGNGNVTIAAVRVHPRPQPDLSTLPHGSGGTVILDATIDSQGAISQLTVVQSLTESIDQQVVATVRGWSFAPATKDGQPVASEQQIVLYYERG